MAYENIEFTYDTFCIGPQAGTYCFVNYTDLNNVLLQVKNSSGTLIRNYTFLPAGVFYTNLSAFPYNIIVDLKYVGPRGRPDFFNGAVFYTMERVIIGTLTLPDNSSSEYSDKCIIRKWAIDNDALTLTLENTFYINSDETYYFDSYTFSVQHQQLSFLDSVAKHTEEISVSNTDGLAVGGLLQLGPSSDVDNTNEVELVYIHSIDTNTVEIRSFDGVNPTRYEYVIGDPITYIGDMFLLSNPRPLLEGSLFIGYADNGNVYRLDQQNYGGVIEYDENAKYTNVQASIWNITTGGLSIVKVNNYMTIDVDGGYTNIKAQVIKTLTKDFEVLSVHAVDYYDNDLYFLQKKIIKLADDGTEIVVSWSNFNYVKDSIIPYGYSTNIITPRDILVKYTQIAAEVIVRDQFNSGVLGANVFFSYTGDPSAVLDPLSGYVTTDVNGRCSVTFTTGSTYQGAIQFRAKADKGSTNQGSQYTNCYRYVEEYVEFTRDFYISQELYEITSNIYVSQFDIKEVDVHLSCFGKYVFGLGNSSITDIETPWARNIQVAIVQQIHEPLLAEQFNHLNIPIVSVYVQQLNKENHLYISQFAGTNDTLQLSQMTSSRHLYDLNKDELSINQFVFIQDAIPPFWEEKVSVNTYIWIRLRPFAYSLDPTTLVFLVKEVNSPTEFDSGYIDVTDLGQITLYDAGGGMFGVDFLYLPESFFTNESIVYVTVQIKDTAPIPNSLSIDYWFKIIDDYRGPVIYNVVPPKDSINLALDIVLEFYVADYGIGIDINSVELFVNDSKVVFSYEYIEDDVYKITYDLANKFNYGTDISVNVVATDKSKFSNSTYEFWTLSFVKSTGPLISMDNAEPRMCEKGVNVTLSNLSFQIYSIDGTGVDVDSISTSIDGKYSNIDTLLLPVIYHIRK